jgi:hypothetical protein
MAVTYFKVESFLFMVLEVLSSDGNYFEMRVISANFGGKGISIDHGKLYSMQESCPYKKFCAHYSLGTGCLVVGGTRLHLRIHRP